MKDEQSISAAAGYFYLRASPEEVVAGYIKALGGTNCPCWDVVKILARIGAPAVEPLCKALDDTNEVVRRFALEALVKIGDANVVEPLCKALRDTYEVVRRVAANALTEIGDSRAVGLLCEALGHADEHIRACAAKALVRIGDARAVEPLCKALADTTAHLGFITVPELALAALARIGDARAITPLIESYIASKPSGYLSIEDFRRKVREALLKFRGEQAVDQFIAALKHQQAWARQFAAECLGKLGDPRAIRPLEEAMKRGPGASEQAAILLAFLRLKKDDLGAPLLVATIDAQEGDRERRAAAVEVLAKLNDERVIPPLLSALEWFAADYRTDHYGMESRVWAIVRGLGGFATLPSMAIVPLAKALGCDGYVSQAYSSPFKNSVIAILKKFNVAQEGERQISSLVHLLQSGSYIERRGAAEAIGVLKFRAAIPSLIAALSDINESVQVQVKAAWALGECPDEQNVEPLVAALDRCDDFHLAWALAHALGRTPDPRAVKALAHLLERCSRRIESFYGDYNKWPATTSLEYIWDTHQAAVAALKRICTEDANAALRHKHDYPWATGS